MAAAPKIELAVLGDVALARAMGEITPAAERRLVRTSLRVGFKITKDAVQAAVPTDNGALKRSIKLRVGKSGKHFFQFRIFTGDTKSLGYRTTLRVGLRGGKQGFAPAAVETGYFMQTKDGMKYIPPRSFVRVPLRATKDAVIKAVGEDLAAGLAAEKAKVGA